MNDIKSDLQMMVHDFGEAVKEIKIYHIADVHTGAAEARQEKFLDFLSWIKGQKDSYIALAGDIANNATRSSVSNVFDEVMRPREQKRFIADALEPVKGKILCMIEGNHERRSGKDADDSFMYDIACKLDLEDVYRENIAFIHLKMGKEKRQEGRRHSFSIAVTHGAGGGMLSGATINRNERFSDHIEGVDALLVAHSHKAMGSRIARLSVNLQNGTIRTRETVILTACPWMDWGGYAAQKMMRPSPTSITYLILDASGEKKRIRLVI